MPNKKMSRREMLKGLGLAVGSAVLASCAPKIVKETVIVEKPVEKVVEKVVKETVIVAGTPKVVEKVVTVAPAPMKVTELQFWPKATYGPDSAEVWRTAVDIVIEKRPDLKVVVTPGTYAAEDEQKLITSMASGTGPDVWSHGGSSGGFWGPKGVPEPLDDLLASSPLAGDWIEKTLFPHRWEGKLYALPFGAYARFFVWRKDMFEEVGLDPEKGPDNWDELADMGQKLAVWDGDDIVRAGLGIPPTGNDLLFYWSLFMYGAGGKWYSDDFKQTLVDSDAGIEALEYIVDLFHKYKVNATYGVQSKVPGAPLIATDQAAIEWQSMGVYSYALKARPELLGLYGYGMPPKGPKIRGTFLFADTLLLNSASKEKEAAWEFIQEMMAYDVLELTALGTVFLPPRKSWYEKFPFRAKEPMIQLGLEALELAYNHHWGPQWTPFRIAFVPYLEEAVLQKRSPADALKVAAEKLNTEILGEV